jgi:pimeloyl-ACP methyl ester carboxylesterase
MRPVRFSARAHPHDRRSATTHVVALHCSGSSGRQWQPLADLLGRRYSVIAPDLFDGVSRGPWPGGRAFTLKDEAAPVIDLIDRLDGPVHLVGHSYGGAVALRAALARATRVASLALYEPMLPHVLKSMGPDGIAAWHELQVLFGNIDQAVRDGAYSRAAETFLDYFNGATRWTSLTPERKIALVHFIPKACLESRAVMTERTPLSAYARLSIPTLLMHGDGTRQPTALIARGLAEVMPGVSLHVLKGADHMAPIARAGDVNACIAEHIANAGRPCGQEASTCCRALASLDA